MSICGGLYLSLSVCGSCWIKKQLKLFSIKSSKQYLSVCGFCFFLIQCVDAVACEHSSIKKQMELFSIKSWKRSLSICSGLILSSSVCVHVCLWTMFNKETYHIIFELRHNRGQIQDPWNWSNFRPYGGGEGYMITVTSVFLFQYGDAFACVNAEAWEQINIL